MDDILIMAGGFGERLWPASSKEFPKQFMTAGDGTSFLQEAVLRALSLEVKGYVVVITRPDIASLCLSQVASCIKGSAKAGRVVVLAEPSPRHTAAAIMSGVYLCQYLSEKDGENKNCGRVGVLPRKTLVLTSDHIINPIDCFTKDCIKASSASEAGYFVCFSISPTAPSTGYGYIKCGGAVGEDKDVQKIERFVEKPSLEVAKAYFLSKEYYWNSGMFAFLSNVLLEEMKNLTPDVYSAFHFVADGNAPPVKNVDGVMLVDEWTELNEVYKDVPSIAIDKAVAEKTKKAVAVTAHFQWHDVGTWDVFASLCKGYTKGGAAEVGGSGNFVYSDIPVALCGVSDLVVVVKNGAALVMKKGSAQKVRDAVRLIEENKGEQ